ncbi:MAG: alpha/beta hydrolase [Parcubacteria group bacterium]|nr:alpha/beta hydrolase [Parcubacteria group bacterium]
MKRVFIVHGWGGYPEEGWFPWLKKELEKHNFLVEVPPMPNSNEPRIETWVNHLREIIIKPNEETFLVGHSIGCQTILRYLESLDPGEKVGGSVFVAGWFNLAMYESDEEKRIAKPWIETPIDFEKVKSHCKKFVAVFSTNDPFVLINDNAPIFIEKLGIEDIKLEKNKGHFSGSDGLTELPVVLEELLKMARK